jgi:myo-inositol-1(or 4)-monophosphatase
VHPLLNIAVQAARAAGRVIQRSLPQADQLQIQRKGASDFVSEVDRGAEAEILRVIRRFHPDHAILAEESGASGTSDWTWVIDPLDGTTNYLHRLPHYAVSIAVMHRGKVEHGVIYAPGTEDLYTASRGRGAQLNNRRLRVSATASLEDALIGTGLPFRDEARIDRYLPTLRAVLAASAGARRAGSAALDLAYVAAGRLDGFWEFDLNTWDIAAGVLLVQEAGGTVTELTGQGEVLETGNVLAGNVKIHHALETLLRTAQTGEA